MICDADSYFGNKPFSTPRKPVETDQKTPVPRRMTTNEETTPLPINTIIIEGYTSIPDFSTVRELIVKLASLNFVQSADLLSDDKLITTGDEKDAPPPRGFLRFVLEVKLKET